MIKQITVSLENAPGRLHETTKLLGQADINLRAVSLASSTDFGVARLLVSDVALARNLLMQAHIPARLDEVIAAELSDVPRSLEKMLAPLVERGISVAYMYAFGGPTPGNAMLVFSCSDNARAEDILEASGIKMLQAKDIGIKNSD